MVKLKNGFILIRQGFRLKRADWSQFPFFKVLIKRIIVSNCFLTCVLILVAMNFYFYILFFIHLQLQSPLFFSSIHRDMKRVLAMV